MGHTVDKGNGLTKVLVMCRCVVALSGTPKMSCHQSPNAFSVGKT